MKGKFQNKKDINFWAIGMQLFNDSTSILYSGNQISQNQSYKFTIYNNIKQSVSGGFYPISQKSPIIYMFIITLILVNMEMNSYSTNCIMTRFTL